MEVSQIIKSTKDGMQKAVEHTLREFSSLHTGKATPAMVEGVNVQAYGTTSKIRDVAAITTPDQRTIVIQPWDKSIIRDIEKAIQEANIGFNPAVDGGIIRVPVPELTGERRAELAKTAGSMAEEGRVRIRACRRDAMDELKAAQKGGLSEDEVKRGEKEVQTETDKFIGEINEYLAAKEKDLKTV